MTADTIVTHVQDHAAAYAVGALVFLVVTVVFRKQVVPVLYHTAEYIAYCTVAHFLLGGFVRAFSWFREETEFKNSLGEVLPSWSPYTTPLDLNFWNRSLYNPHWLFWFEAVVAVGMLYIVIVIRPTRLRHKYVASKRPAPGALSGSKPYAGLARKDGAKMKTARSR